MLSASPDPMRTALNRLTFGARDVDVTYANSIGLEAWLNEQLNAPAGDDPELAAHLAAQTMHIKYAAPGAGQPSGTWKAVNEFRPLNYLNAPTETLWAIVTQTFTTYAPAERNRIMEELMAATWIRNAHSRYQVREFMTDFWHNHFNIGKAENQLATALLPVYDRTHIRPNVFGNFRELLNANAISSSMMLYLDNATSTATTPNENYAREIMELHTLGGTAYWGTEPPDNPPTTDDGVALGFTDDDVIQASRALSGWTIQFGQRRLAQESVPSTGKFFYNPAQHNTQATTVMSVNIAGIVGDMQQGFKFLDIIAYHPATADHIVRKLCVRMFGDNPPQAVIDRGVAAWNAGKTSPTQIRDVLTAIVLGGPEIHDTPPAKLRRPYERVIAMARTTDMIISANALLAYAFDSLKDGLFAWQAPNGRPDTDGYWLATGAMLSTWNFALLLPYLETNHIDVAAQTPPDVMRSPIGIVEYWVGRMVGHRLSDDAMTALYDDQSGPVGVPTVIETGNAEWIEGTCRRLVGLIAASESFAYR